MSEKTSPRFLLGVQDQQLVAKKDQVPCGAHRNPLQATIKRRKLTWLGYVTRHDSLFKIILQGGHHSPGWSTPRSAEVMLDGLRQRVDVRAHAGTVHNSLMQNKEEKKRTELSSLMPPYDPICRGTDLTRKFRKSPQKSLKSGTATESVEYSAQSVEYSAQLTPVSYTHLTLPTRRTV